MANIKNDNINNVQKDKVTVNAEQPNSSKENKEIVEAQIVEKNSFVEDIKKVIDINVMEYQQYLYIAASKLVDRRKFKRNFLNYVRMKYANFDQEIYSEFLHKKIYLNNENNVIINLKFNASDSEDKKNALQVNVEYQKVNISQIKLFEYVWKGGSDEVNEYIKDLSKSAGSRLASKTIALDNEVNIIICNKDGSQNSKYPNEQILKIDKNHQSFINKQVGDKVQYNVLVDELEGVEAGEYLIEVKKINQITPLSISELSNKLKVKEQDLNNKIYSLILQEFTELSKVAQRMEFFNFIENKLSNSLKNTISEDLIKRQELEIKTYMQHNNENKNIDIDRYARRRAIVYVFLNYYAQQYNIDMKEVENQVLQHKAIQKDIAKISFSDLKKKIELVNI